MVPPWERQDVLVFSPPCGFGRRPTTQASRGIARPFPESVPSPPSRPPTSTRNVLRLVVWEVKGIDLTTAKMPE